jgi:hypothetical protein
MLRLSIKSRFKDLVNLLTLNSVSKIHKHALEMQENTLVIHSNMLRNKTRIEECIERISALEARLLPIKEPVVDDARTKNLTEIGIALLNRLTDKELEALLVVRVDEELVKRKASPSYPAPYPSASP